MNAAFGFILAVAALVIAGQRQAVAQSAEPAQVITAVTEELPPFHFTENGSVTGVLTEVVRASLAAAQLNADIRVLPWARAYGLALEQPNVLIFSIVRTAQREDLFKWVGQIDETRNYLYARGDSRITMTSLDDAKKYSIGTVIGDAREEYFKRHGFLVPENLESVTTHEMNYEKLKIGHIDLWPMIDVGMAYIVRKAGDDPATAVKPVWPILDMNTGYSGDFMAFSRSTPDPLVTRLREGLESIRATGVYAGIQRKWMICQGACPN